MPSKATVRNRSNLVLGVCIAIFPLLLAGAPVGIGIVRVGWVLLWIGVVALVIVRAARMSVGASAVGLVVRNFGRDHRIAWNDVAAVEAGPSDNITARVTTIVVRRADGSTVIGRGASSYSRQTVERWRDELVSVRNGAE